MNLQEKYDFKEFIQRIYINSSPEKVYDLFSNADLIITWFVKKASYHTADGRLKKGNERIQNSDEYFWEWVDGSKLNGTIIETEDKEDLKFTFGNDVHVQVKIKSANERTLVELIQRQNMDDYEMRFENYIACFPGWQFYLNNLKSVCEGGLDLREENPDIEMLVNI